MNKIYLLALLIILTCFPLHGANSSLILNENLSEKETLISPYEGVKCCTGSEEKPKIGQSYFSIYSGPYSFIAVESIWEDDAIDNSAFDNYNVFESSQQAQMVADFLKNVLKAHRKRIRVTIESR